jgi:hypothetical protein
MFAKILDTFLNPEIDYHQYKSNNVVDQYYSAARKGGSAFYSIQDYFKFKSTHIKNIFTILPTPYYAEFTGTGLVTPHIDGGKDTVALNYYLNVGSGDETVFYKKKDDSVLPYPNTNSYNVNDLDELGRFSAKPFEAWLLDVNKIHGIIKQDDQTRTMITFRWKHYSFEEIYNSLNVGKDSWSNIE